MTDFFPYAEIRDIQKQVILDVEDAIREKKHAIMHAPTGLGKTVATLAPAIEYALKNEKKVFFLTSRHTQHIIAINTIDDIKKKHGAEILAVDIIGKKWMCSYPGVEALHSGEFSEFCKKQREENKCEFFTKTKQGNKLTTEGKLAFEELSRESPCHVEQLRKKAADKGICAYEIATSLASKAQVIVADYNYLFSPRIRDSLFKRAGISLEDCIVIVDEAHNLPERTRALLTSSISTLNIKRALSEAKKIKRPEIIEGLNLIQDCVNSFSQGIREGEQALVDKDELIKNIQKTKDYEALIEELETAADTVRIEKQQSSIAGIARFLENWKGQDTGFVRFISHKNVKKESVITINYRCLDPSLVTRDTIKQTHTTILMSGTLTPTSMYKDLLGFPKDTIEKTYKNPFPEKNRLTLVIPDTTTKFSERNPDQYTRIANICADITNSTPGNCAIFFPSYYVRNEVYRFFSPRSKKTAFVEDQDMTKEEKSEFLERFKKYEKSGAVLLGAIGGSYGEGIDLPGNLLNCVVIVGLPLLQPNLETKKLIDYYEEKFGKGWDYGYVGPAFSKCIQSAGRCIRSETDRGVIIFLDERYTWNQYFKHFPLDWDIKITKLYSPRISEFFSKSEFSN
jgi:DNA excision repair protein ERCC-2